MERNFVIQKENNRLLKERKETLDKKISLLENKKEISIENNRLKDSLHSKEIIEEYKIFGGIAFKRYNDNTPPKKIKFFETFRRMQRS